LEERKIQFCLTI